MRIPVVPFLVLAAVIYGCNNPTEPIVTGQWGSNDASVTLSPTGGMVEFACAEATIDAGWTSTGDGHWSATGRLASTAGPVGIEGRPTRPARFDGVVIHNRMQFRTILTDANDTIGPYTLLRGVNGPGNRCL